jgi:hypothetical protein
MSNVHRATFLIAVAVVFGLGVARADSTGRILRADTVGNHLFVEGVGFDVRSTPVVVLGGMGLVVDSFSGTQIVANLPPNLPPASYALCVVSRSTLDPIACRDPFGVAVGALGPQGPQGPQGIQGVPGPAGPPGTGAVHATRLYVSTSTKCNGTSIPVVTTSTSCAYTACSGNPSLAPQCDTGCIQTGSPFFKQECSPFGGCTNVDQCAPCACSTTPIGFAVQ